MLRLMAKRKRSEHGQESKKQKKKNGTEVTGLREGVSLMDEQERLDQLEKRLESTVFLIVSNLLPFLSFLKLSIKFPNCFTILKCHQLSLLSSQSIYLLITFSTSWKDIWWGGEGVKKIHHCMKSSEKIQ